MSYRHEMEDAQREDPIDLAVIWERRDRDDAYAPIEAVSLSETQWATRVQQLERDLAEAEWTIDTLRGWIGSMWANNRCPF